MFTTYRMRICRVTSCHPADSHYICTKHQWSALKKLYTPKPRPAEIWGLAAGLSVSLANYEKNFMHGKTGSWQHQPERKWCKETGVAGMACAAGTAAGKTLHSLHTQQAAILCSVSRPTPTLCLMTLTSDPKINGFPGRIVEYFYVKFGLVYQFWHLFWATESFVRSLLRAGSSLLWTPALRPLCRSNAPAQGEEGNW